MDCKKLTTKELKARLKARGDRGYSKKNKKELCRMYESGHKPRASDCVFRPLRHGQKLRDDVDYPARLRIVGQDKWYDAVVTSYHGQLEVGVSEVHRLKPVKGGPKSHWEIHVSIFYTSYEPMKVQVEIKRGGEGC